MAKTEEILERILAADKLAAAETAVPETPAETAAPETPPAACDCAHHRERVRARYRARDRRNAVARSRRGSVGSDAPLTTVDEAMERSSSGRRPNGEYYQLGGPNATKPCARRCARAIG